MIFAAIDSLNRRLDRVNVEQLDWRRCLALYDSPNTFFFLDPPYTECQVKQPLLLWKAEDIRTLRERLKSLQGRWLLTINDRKEHRELFRGCKIRPLVRLRGINRKTTVTKYRELIVSS